MAANPSTCVECGTRLSARNATGRCKSHVSKFNMSRPETRAKLSETRRRMFAADPVKKARQAAFAIAARNSPNGRAAAIASLVRTKAWVKGNASQPAGSEPRRRAAQRSASTKLAWCPSHLRDSYRELRRKDYKAAEARSLILEQNEVEMRRWRRSVGAPQDPAPELEPQVPEFDEDATVLERVLETVSALTRLAIEELTGPGRQLRLTRPRWAVMLALAEGDEPMSMSAIGRELGRDHHTVSYGLKQAAKLRDSDAAFAALCAKVAGA